MTLCKLSLRLGLLSKRLKIWEIVYSQDVARPNKACEIIADVYYDLADKTINFSDLFEGRRVLELGSGTLLGACFRAQSLGAACFTAVDPKLERELVFDKRVMAIFEKTLTGFECETGQSKVDFAKRFREFFSFEKDIANLPTNSSYEVVLSISCLEHVHNLSNCLNSLAQITSEQAKHIHIVNFSNHISKDQPFHELYESPPDRFRSHWSDMINCLRCSDVQRIFNESGLDLDCYSLEVADDLLPSEIDGYWTERYTRSDLKTKVAVFTNLEATK